MIEIRLEQPRDHQQVRALNQQAFGQPAEAAVVDQLRKACAVHLSLVAVEDGQVLGHIFFTPVEVEGPEPARGMGLAPLAVAPARQRQGLGSALTRHGLAILKERGCPFVIVLGHPEYYPRFGFVPASQFNLRCHWEGVPDEAFMVLELKEGSLPLAGGVARYRQEFDQACSPPPAPRLVPRPRLA